MNDVPVLFYEQLFRNQLFNTKDATYHLAGLFGAVAADAFQNAAFHIVNVENGKFYDLDYHPHFKLSLRRLEEVSSKHHWYTSVVVSADDDEYSTNSKALRELSAVTRGRRVILWLETENLCKKLEKWIGADCAGCFEVRAFALKIPETLIQKSILNYVTISDSKLINDESATLLLQLLQQSQFYCAKFYGLSQVNLTKLFSVWKTNSSAMVGKVVKCAHRYKRSIALSLGFRRCTEEEKRSFARFHPELNVDWSDSFKFIKINKKGEGIYWFSKLTEVKNKTMFVFV